MSVWKYILIACCMLLPVLGWAQATCDVDIYVFHNHDNQIKVDCRFTGFQSPNADLYLNLPTSLDEKIHHSAIENFQIKYKNNVIETTAHKLRDGHIYLPKLDKLESVTYVYDIDLLQQSIYKPSSTFSRNKNFAILQMENLIPNFALQENISYNIKFHYDSCYHLFTNNTQLLKTHELRNVCYSEALENLICFSTQQPETLTLQNKKVQLLFCQDETDKNIKADFLQYTQKAIDVCLKRMPQVQEENLYFVFYITTQLATAELNRTSIGGANKKNSFIFYLPQYANPEINKKVTHQLVAHEMYHLLIPQLLHSDIKATFSRNNTRHTWLYEGMVDYLSLKTLLHEKLLSENDFLNILRKKILIYDNSPRVSLAALSHKISSTHARKHYQLFYEKGALVAFCMDLSTIMQSQGKQDIFTIMNRLVENHKTDHTFHENRLMDEMIALSSEDMLSIFQDHVYGKKPFDLRYYFSMIGYEYFPSRHNTYWTFGDFNMDINQEKDGIRVVNVFDNTLGLMDGDLIISVKNTPLTETSKSRAAAQLKNPHTQEYLRLQVRRNNSIIELEGVPQNRTDVVKYQLVPMQVTTMQQIAHDRFMNGLTKP